MPAEGGTGRVFDFAVIYQEASNWCWAAVAQAVLSTMKHVNEQQEQVATAHLRASGRPDVCDAAHKHQSGGGSCSAEHCTKPCNAPHSIEAVLGERGIEAVSLPALLDDSIIKAEVQDDRPIVCRIRYQAGAHYVVIAGWIPYKNEIAFLIHDPLSKSRGPFVKTVWAARSALTSYGYSLDGGPVGLCEESWRLRA